MAYREYWPIYIVDTDIPDWLEKILVKDPLWLLPYEGSIARASLLAKIAFVEKDLVDRYCKRCSISPEVIGAVKEKVKRLKDIALRSGRNYNRIRDEISEITRFPWEKYCIKIPAVACFVSQGVMELNTMGKPTILVSPERVEEISQRLCKIDNDFKRWMCSEGCFLRTTIAHEIVHSYHYHVCEHNSPREVLRSSISDGYYTLGEEMLATAYELLESEIRYPHFCSIREVLVKNILSERPLEYKLGVALFKVDYILRRRPCRLSDRLSEMWVRKPSSVHMMYIGLVRVLGIRNALDRHLFTLIKESIQNKDYINAWKLMLLGFIDLLERWVILSGSNL